MPRLPDMPDTQSRAPLSKPASLSEIKYLICPGLREAILKDAEAKFKREAMKLAERHFLIKTMLVCVKKEYDETYKYFTRRGSRVLALAGKEIGNGNDKINHLAREQVKSELNFAGFLVFHGPLKEDTVETLKMLAESSHRCIMITGDNPLTDVHVARDVEIVDRETLKFLYIVQSYVLLALAFAILITAEHSGQTAPCNPHAVVVIFRPFKAIHAGINAAWVLVAIVVLVYSALTISDYMPVAQKWIEKICETRKPDPTQRAASGDRYRDLGNAELGKAAMATATVHLGMTRIGVHKKHTRGHTHGRSHAGFGDSANRGFGGFGGGFCGGLAAACPHSIHSAHSVPSVRLVHSSQKEESSSSTSSSRSSPPPDRECPYLGEDDDYDMVPLTLSISSTDDRCPHINENGLSIPSPHAQHAPPPSRGGPPPPVILDDTRRGANHTTLALMNIDRVPPLTWATGYTAEPPAASSANGKEVMSISATLRTTASRPPCAVARTAAAAVSSARFTF
ncbi:hypothetical protein DFH11DRAFT_1732615 [Phellopilus nigrolimitatus]|nr:hypothetical protein DFH11DRAFT_1732615 [Phellopilus nigrolimitatus]